MFDRIAAHTIVWKGQHYKLSVAYMDECGNVVVRPLEQELPNTVFVNGEVEIVAADGAICVKRGNTAQAL